jgi:uncharacterized phiE125 gp8 family phage protein
MTIDRNRPRHATYKATVEPTVEPITLDSLKTALRILSCDFDEELGRILVTARRQVENDAQRKLCTQTVQLLLDGFPPERSIELRLPPVQSVTSITYYDENNDLQTMSSSLYYTDLSSTPPRIVLNEDEDWPDTEDRPNAVIVQFVAGYGAASAVPVEAKLAIQHWARHAWSGCAGDSGAGSVYANLINMIAWTGYHKV